MSIASEASRVDFTGNGTQSVFSYTFKVFLEDDLLVTVRNTSTGTETTLVKTTDYTITGVGETTGGTITLVDAAQSWLTGGNLSTGYAMTVRRSPDLIQSTDIRNQGAYFPEGIENQFDKQVHIDQKLQDEITRSVRMPETISPGEFDTSLPAGLLAADKALVTNPTGDGFAVGPDTGTIAAAEGFAIDAGEHRDTAQLWANKTDGSVVDQDTLVDSLEYSSKAYALGGTNVTDTAGRGAAKEWATKTSDTVDTAEYSAKEYAQGVQTRGLAGGGSSKDWAQYTGGTVDDVEFSSKKYAADAAASAAAAATSAGSALWNDVDFKAFGDSPITVLDGDAGKMFAIDCSGGNVVVNLPSIAVLTLSGPWAIGFKKTDTSTNTITINPSGAEEINGAASPLVISRADAGSTLIPDDDPTPDNWTALTFGEVPITGAIVGDSDTQDLSNKTFTDAITLEELSATPSNPAAGDKKFYAKNDGKIYTLDDGGNEVEVGSGSGGSSIGGPSLLDNLGLETSVASNILTVAVKQKDGSTDATSVLPVTAEFRSATLTEGSSVSRTVEAALSIDVPAGGTLGHRNGTDDYIYVYLIDNSGTVDVGLSSVILDEGVLHSTTSITASSDDSGLYANSTLTDKAIRLIARLKSNQTTAGQWATDVDEISLATTHIIKVPEENLEVQAAVDTTTSVANTYVDATGISLELGPGIWDIGYNVSMQHEIISGSNNSLINSAITDAANTILDGSVCMTAETNITTSSTPIVCHSRNLRITVDSSTTYKMRIRSSLSAAAGRARIISENFTGGLTNPDNESVFWARRIS